ncbi:MAG TPA: histidine phosphatase family protein [Pyrinomonadaceae bacterium]|jgi:phosphohistidine phosphatase
MKTLFLLRHAKSSGKDETLLDVERPLNGRGRRASLALGGFFKREKIIPDLVLSSSATRARETTGILMDASKLKTDLRFDERIYEAGARRLLEVIRQIERSKKTVLLVGHNPGLEELLTMLTGAVEPLPTGALSKVALSSSQWADLDDKGATLEWIVRPRQLLRD